MAITTQQIHEAADQLQAQDIKPTLAEVRKALKGGSFTTISEAMKSWHQDHKDEQELKQVELPSGIDQRLQALGADMWQTAIDIAHERLAKEREALEVIKAKSQQDVDELSESVKTLELEQSDLLAQLDDVTATAETATTAAATATADLDALAKSLSETEHKLEIERNKADSARTQLVEVRERLDKTQSELTASLSHAAKLEAQADSSKSEIERLKLELANSKQEHDIIRLELTDRTAERNTSNEKLASVNGKLEALTGQMQTLAVEHKQLTSDNKALSIDISKMTAERDTLEKTVKEK